MSILVEEAFPEFEPKATEYMKLTRFLAGLDQGLQIKCHERGVKTFEEAFQVATQAERARQAAKLVPPTPCPSISSVTTAAQSVNTIDNDASLRKIVLHLTDTVRDLSHNFSTVKLALNNNSRRSRHDAYSPGRSQRSPRRVGGVQKATHLHGGQCVDTHLPVSQVSTIHRLNLIPSTLHTMEWTTPGRVTTHTIFVTERSPHTEW